MKKLFSYIFIAVILLNSYGCSGENTNAPDISEYYSGLSSFEAKAVVTAHYSDYTVDFTLMFSYDSEVGSTVAVENPTELEGISASFDGDALLVGYDGAFIETGVPDPDSVPPIASLPQLFRVWSDGVVDEQGKERISDTDYIIITHKSDSGAADITYRTWFLTDSLLPYKAKILKNGQTKIQCEFLLINA